MQFGGTGSRYCQFNIRNDFNSIDNVNRSSLSVEVLSLFTGKSHQKYCYIQAGSFNYCHCHQ